ncbi:MAG: hypothetical protein IKC69_05065 [Clostridia bacterium]|nr:hypothetical protein [Clostridia bacterium]
MDKTKIYGVSFDESIPFGGEKRILDSVGLENNYVVGERFVKDGKNDFDSAYPFGAIRRACVKIENGKRHVILEGEEGFSLTGEAGEVMVRIPKFYSKREKQGSVEKWMISGTKHPGFALEPAFLRDGKELDYVFVGAYNSAPEQNGAASYSGACPSFCKPLEEYLTEYRERGFDVYDLALNLMLQKLILIEFATRRLKYELGGFLFVEYYYRLHKGTAIHSVGKNYFTKAKLGRNFLYYPGMQMMFCCPKSHHPEPILRTLTEVCQDPENPDLIRYTYDGEDLSPMLVPGQSHAGGFVQRNGMSDTLSYHTGRTNHIPPLTRDYPPTTLKAFLFKATDALPPMVTNEELVGMVNAFRYRGIENVWGNIWEFCAGLCVKELSYYYTFDPALYDSEPLSAWRCASFAAPEQNHLGEWNPTPPIWARTMGLDEKEPLMPLPAKTCYGEPGNYYDAAFYAYKDKDYSGEPLKNPHATYRVAVGGGYDHYWFGSLFTYRCFLGKNVRSWLYSTRICLRK